MCADAMSLQCCNVNCLNTIPLRCVRMRVSTMLIILAAVFGFAMFIAYTNDKDNKGMVIPKSRMKVPSKPSTVTTREIYKGWIKDGCLKYFESGRMQRDVYIDVLGRGNHCNGGIITLVTQLSSSRIDKLYRIALRWSGSISATVYMDNSTTATDFTKIIKAVFAPRCNIALHLVSENGVLFPVNFLRNVALDNAETKYVFLSDVDFEPMPQLDVHLQDYISKGYLRNQTALVVPVFESFKANFTFPETKADILTLWKRNKTIIPFHFKIKNRLEVATAGHAPTLYLVWAKARKPYNVIWKEHYEPYVVVKRALAPKYWPYLVSRYFDKASHLAELFSMGFSFVVLPDVFAIHTPHQLKLGTTMEYRCGLKEYSRFKNYLLEKYGVKIPNNN